MDQGAKFNIKKYQRYHFIGIGGVGMSNLALLMLAKGFKVSGSDVRENDLIRDLKAKGADIFIGHDISNIGQAECVVYSSAIKTSNPEMFHAYSQRMPILRRAELLAELVNREVGVTVAGAHGKTTTSSMASFLLISAGLKPTTFVGGSVNQGSYNANLGIGRHIVAEVDESDGTFLCFSPHFSIITNIDMEHVDHYQTFERIKDSFARFAGQTVPGGVIIACGDDEVLTSILKNVDRRFTTYGFGDQNDWVAKAIQCDANGSSYECFHKGRFVGRFFLAIPGKHNVLNSLAIVALGHELKIDLPVIQSALFGFNGVKRRFQRKGEVGGVLVIDDYGHHPTEIAATLQTARTLGRKRVLAVFQPHRYTRTKFLMDEFATCFNLTDELLLTDIYAASEAPIEGVTAQALLERIAEHHPQGSSYCPKDQVVERVLEMARPGDLVLTLGAGDVTTLSDKIVRCLQERGEVVAPLALEERRAPGDLGLIGVVMGGCSSEREVSLKSGHAVLEALSAEGCRAVPIDLTTDEPDAVKTMIAQLGVDVAFITLHGRFGEDGGIQTLLDEMRLPYIGCDAAASYTAFNKCVAQRIFEANGVPTPRTCVISGPESFDAETIERMLGKYPFFVKPACEGSSIGIGMVREQRELVNAAQQAFEHGREIVVQECIRGRELTVGILGQEALPIVEVRSQHAFFDFEAKYKDQMTEYLVPADLPEDLAARIRKAARAAYKAIGCEGFGRVDVLMDNCGYPFVLEINTIPGFTTTSLLPKAARQAGIGFGQLCMILIEMAYGKTKKIKTTPTVS